MSYEIEYSDLFPVTDPRAEYIGFKPGTTLLKAGTVRDPGRMPLPCDMLLDRDCAVKMRDGITIYVDVYRPVGDEKVPAILSWGPAGKGGHNNMLDNMGPPPEDMPKDAMTFDAWTGRKQDQARSNTHKAPPRMGVPRDALSGYQAWESFDPAHWVQYGYAVVAADARGCYMSEGDVRYFGELDAQDAYDTIEWLARQPWCNEKVAMAGSSWYAMTQWFTASYNPPHLAAIAPWEGEGDLYRDEYLRGGIPMMTLPGMNRTYGAGRIEDINKMIAKYPLYNDYWASKSMNFENITCPAYIVASYASQMHSRGTFDGFRRLGSRDKWLRVHNKQEWVDLYDQEKIADCRRFFDHFLKGIDNGWENTPRVRLSILDPGGEDRVNVPENEWPLKRQQLKKFYLDASDGSLKPQKPEAEAAVSYDTDKEFDCRRVFSMAFDHDTDVIGYCKIKLWLEVQGFDDMDIFVKFDKTDADGNILFQDSVCFLYTGPDAHLRVSLRQLDPEKSTENEPYHTFSTVQKLSPGEIVPVELVCWPTGLHFRKGERLNVSVAGYDYFASRAMDRPAPDVNNHGVHIIHTGGKFDSHILIPLVDEK